MLIRAIRPACALFAISVVVVAASACTLNPTAGSAAKEYAPVLCQRVQACEPASYAKTYPKDSMGDNSQCVSTLLQAIKDPDARDACTQKQVDTCTNDMKAQPCDKVDASLMTMDPSLLLPPSCNNC
jgi:hypothetical protein